MPRYALESGAKLILIDMGKTPLDDLVHLKIEGKIGEIIPKIVVKVKEEDY